VHYKHAIGETQHFQEVARYHHDGQALLAGQGDDQTVNLGARTDVNTSRRLVDNEDPRLGSQPFGDHDFLLVATGEIPDGF
jgi:hypothetical protein